MIENYTDESIKVLSDLEHIRKRSSMYISTDRPSYQMFTEIMDNAVDEAMNGYADKLVVDINYQESKLSIQDNGRGLPQGMNKDLNKPTIYAIYQKLNAGGKYDQDSYSYSGGLNGVGSTVVNALSKQLEVVSWRGQDVIQANFEYGEDKGYKKYQCKEFKSKDSGTKVTYIIDREHSIFVDTLADYEQEIVNKLHLLKTLMPKVSITYNGSSIKSKDFRSFVQLSKEPLLSESILIEKKDYSLALNWSKDTNKHTHKAYCNSIFTPQGGDHVNAVHNAITNILGSDGLYGLNLAISINYPRVEFDSQAKTKAISRDMKTYLTDSVISELKYYLRKNPDIKESITNLIAYKRNELNKRNNKSNVRRDRKSTFLSSLGNSGFADCNTKNREEAELYIVEGNSAAGSAKQARDVETQAIMPIRGKILNVLTSDMKSILNNKEIATIYSNLDTGIFEDFNIKKSRYGKVIIFSDADEDGKNIASLLISLFMYLSPELVDAGMLYLSLPPLYGTMKNKEFIPIHDEKTKEEYLKKGFHITRFKGLGEMNPTQLRQACMDPETRHMMRIGTTAECMDRVTQIMGANTQFRKNLLIEEGILY